MPKFFLPFGHDADTAEKTYSQIKAAAQGTNPWKILPDRIFAVDHVHNGKLQHSEVGQPDPGNGETVIAIFRTDEGPFLVCTPSRGVLGGGVMLTDQSGTVTLFET